MLGFLSKIFGSPKSEKDIKVLMPNVEKALVFYKEYEALTNDQLRAKTPEFKAKIADYLKDIVAEINTLKIKAEALPAENILQKDDIYQEVDALIKKKDDKLEEILKELLPEAFALVKETGRRFSQNQTLESKATELDIILATAKSKTYITIQGNTCIFKNTWMAGGAPIIWNMVHYDVQLIGGSVLHDGKISEMATGEGKTLVSTLPMYLNAFAS